MRPSIDPDLCQFGAANNDRGIEHLHDNGVAPEAKASHERYVDELAQHPDSITGHFLAHPLAHPLVEARAPVTEDGRWLRLEDGRRTTLGQVGPMLPRDKLRYLMGVGRPEAMLEAVAAERRPNSRLACQLKASAALDGLVLTLPDCQE